MDYIGHFEALQEEFEVIKRRFGLRELNHYNSTGTGNEKWMEYYDKDMRDLVFETYREDFKSFGYEGEYKKIDGGYR